MARPANPQPRLKRGYWTVRIQGKDHHLGKDQRKAFAKFHRLMRDTLIRGDSSPDKPQTIAGTIEVWLRLHPSPSHVGWSRHFARFAGTTYIDEVRFDLLHNFHDHILKSRWRKSNFQGAEFGEPLPFSLHSIINFLRAAQSVMRLAASRKWCDMPDIPKLAKPRFVDRGTDRDALWENLTAMPKYSARIFKFLASTGCRPGEAIGLLWDQVRLDHRVCVLPDHKTADKTGEARIIALTDEAIAVLSTTPRTDHPNVFLNTLGVPHKIGQPEVRRWYARMLIDRDNPGDRPKARELLTEAVAMYRQIGMPRHLEMAEAMLGEE